MPGIGIRSGRAGGGGCRGGGASDGGRSGVGVGRGGGEAGCVDGGAGHGVLEELEDGCRLVFVGELEALGVVDGVERKGEDGEKVWRGDDLRRDDEHEISSIDFLFSIIHQTSKPRSLVSKRPCVY